MGTITFVLLYIYLPFVVCGILSIYFTNQPKTIGELVDDEDFTVSFIVNNENKWIPSVTYK